MTTVDLGQRVVVKAAQRDFKLRGVNIMLGQWGKYPWSMGHGVEKIHPDDLDEFKTEANNFKVYECTGETSDYITLKYGEKSFKVKSAMNFTDLSKEVSYALRHAPHEYGLCLDEYGWVEVHDLVSALRRQERYASLSVDDIEKMIQASEKKRHELSEMKIRALYGHSIEKKISMKPLPPPDVLYHGTAHRYLQSILDVGLLPQKRQYVHLSEDVETAVDVGKRRDHDPVVLRIDAKRAWDDAVLFYLGNEKVWMADKIPPKYVAVI